MHEPDGYPEANDMVLAEAEASDSLLVPFCRLDPHDDPLAEAERCLARGRARDQAPPARRELRARPSRAAAVFALADERRLPVLCHAGRGIPALGRHAIEACARYPGMRLILAHAGISDLAWIWREAPEHPNLFFDTAWWSPSDLQALFALVPPGQILFASDAPYGATAMSATWALRHALQVGLSPDQMRSVMGGQLARLLAGEEPADLGPAAGRRAGWQRRRCSSGSHTFLLTSLGQVFAGIEPDGDARARHARVRRGRRRAAGPPLRVDRRADRAARRLPARRAGAARPLRPRPSADGAGRRRSPARPDVPLPDLS